MTQTLLIPGWHPTRLNVLLRCHWAKKQRLLRADAERVILEALVSSIRPARGKRRVSVTLHYPKGRTAADPDNTLKSLFDALVKARLLVDDSAVWCEIGSVRMEIGAKATVVMLEDIECE